MLRVVATSGGDVLLFCIRARVRVLSQLVVATLNGGGRLHLVSRVVGLFLNGQAVTFLVLLTRSFEQWRLAVTSRAEILYELSVLF